MIEIRPIGGKERRRSQDFFSREKEYTSNDEVTSPCFARLFRIPDGFRVWDSIEFYMFYRLLDMVTCSN
jgi:hypothetical protein